MIILFEVAMKFINNPSDHLGIYITASQISKEEFSQL